MTIQKHHGCQSDLNLALLNRVAQLGQASYATLFAEFGNGAGSEILVKAHARFGKKMEYLTYSEQLSSTGRGHDRVFTLGVDAGKPGIAARWSDRATRRPKIKPVPAAAPTDQVIQDDTPPQGCQAYWASAPTRTPAPSYNAMQAPVYVTPRSSAALPPGALDYQRHASAGQRC
jgi:hypothetical protein